MSDKDIAVNAVRLADENNHYYGTERSEELGLAVRALADEVERLRKHLRIIHGRQRKCAIRRHSVVSRKRDDERRVRRRL